jgi:hypothetical protein
MAWQTMTFLDLDSAASAVVNAPAYGYGVEFHMPICVSQAADGSYPVNGFFDPPAEDGVTFGTYDYRVLKNALCRMTNAQKNTLNTFMRGPLWGRGQNFKLALAGTGFYPFGIDKQGTDFIVREIGREQSGKQMRPFRWYEDSIDLVLVSDTGIAPTLDPVSQGGLYVGVITTGFMYPQNGIKVISDYAVDTQIMQTGLPSSINGPMAGDSWTASFALICNRYNTNALINQLITVSRTSDITLVIPDHYDMFGADNAYLGAGGTFTTKFLGSSRTDKEIILSIKHIGYDQFEIPLTFWMKEKIA